MDVFLKMQLCQATYYIGILANYLVALANIGDVQVCCHSDDDYDGGDGVGVGDDVHHRRCRPDDGVDALHHLRDDDLPLHHRGCGDLLHVPWLLRMV